jgi:hypothetical protein
MSAPQTNIDVQKRWHRWPLIGIALALAFGALMALALTFGAMDDEGAPLSPSTVEGETVPAPGASPPASETADPPPGG